MLKPQRKRQSWGLIRGGDVIPLSICGQFAIFGVDFGLSRVWLKGGDTYEGSAWEDEGCASAPAAGDLSVGAYGPDRR